MQSKILLAGQLLDGTRLPWEHYHARITQTQTSSGPIRVRSDLGKAWSEWTSTHHVVLACSVLAEGSERWRNKGMKGKLHLPLLEPGLRAKALCFSYILYFLPPVSCWMHLTKSCGASCPASASKACISFFINTPLSFMYQASLEVGEVMRRSLIHDCCMTSELLT